jgi:hypothetical protein
MGGSGCGLTQALSWNLPASVCFCLFFVHLHTVAIISTKFGTMVNYVPTEVLDS